MRVLGGLAAAARRVALAALGAGLLAGTLWGFGAIYFDGPGQRGPAGLGLAGLWCALTAVATLRARSVSRAVLVWAACFALVLLPWSAIRPSNDRNWKAEWSRTAHVEIDGDLITIHNYRDFDYEPDGHTTERWTTRRVRLSRLRGLDYFHDAFGGDLIAHPILSFDFGDDGHVALSIETRREQHESFSEFGGLFKMFELQFVFGDERDLVRVRTNVRDEPVLLYRIDANDQLQLRELFLHSLHELNLLHGTPRFYNLVTANCTTSIWALLPASSRRHFDYRVLANGRLDALMYERGLLITNGLSFPELREGALINAAARQAHDDPAFSARIREGRPGYGDGPDF